LIVILLARVNHTSRYTMCTSTLPDYHHLHSSPTRRSSDLPPAIADAPFARMRAAARSAAVGPLLLGVRSRRRRLGVSSEPIWMRSEEHTSELQSRENLVCRLLLEKKKKQNHAQTKLKHG